MFNSLIKAWVGAKLPPEHYFKTSRFKPEKGWSLLRFYLVQILYHPVKRRLAKLWIRVLRKVFKVRLVAITGSAGKTTIKDFTRQLVSPYLKVVASKENIDPIYNIPATIMRCTPLTKVLIIEMGVEFPGEMDFYLSLTGSPDVSLLSTIGNTHTEYFGSKEGVLREKRKLVEASQGKGVVILNVADPMLKVLAGEIPGVVRYGLSTKADYQGNEVKVGTDLQTRFLISTPDSRLEVALPFVGEHYASNYLASFSIAKCLGLTNQQILKSTVHLNLPPHRLQVISRGKTLILDDTYNSNPLAVKVALKALVAVAGNKKKIALLGEMKELGERSVEAHQEIGQYVAKIGVDKLVAYQGDAEYILAAAKEGGVTDATFVTDRAELKNILSDLSNQANNVILVKGSRALKMEELLP